MLLSVLCYFTAMIKSIPKINGLFNFITVGCQYGKRSDRKQGESTTFVIPIQTFSRERELSTQCDWYCHWNGNDVTLLIYFLSCRNQEILPSRLRAICKSFWAENESTIGFRLAATKQQYISAIS